MTDNATIAHPAPDLQRLDRLVGTWTVSGPEIDGTVTYAWMEGGFFLIQHVDFVHSGRKIKGIEIIGHLQPFGEAPSPEIRSRFYDTLGNTLDYVYEVNGDILTIWGGEKGSPAYYKGTFSADGNTNAARVGLSRRGRIFVNDDAFGSRGGHAT